MKNVIGTSTVQAESCAKRLERKSMHLQTRVHHFCPSCGAHDALERGLWWFGAVSTLAKKGL